MHRRTFLAAGSALGLGSLGAVRASPLAGARAKQVYGGQTILIGQSTVLSGPSALLGMEMTAGMKAAFAAANKNGGVGGRKIELVTLDDRYEPEPCKENTDKLIKQGVFALGSYFGTATSLAAFPAIVEAGIPFVGTLSGAEVVRKFHPNIFHTRPSYNRECQTLVKQLLAYSDSTQVAIFAQDDGFGEAVTQGVTQALAERGKKPVAVGKVARNSLDVAQAAQVIRDSGARAVALGSLYGAAAKLVDALGPQGQAMMYCGVSPIGTTGRTKELGAKAHGIGITQVFPYPWKDSPPLVAEFRKAMALVDAEISYGALEGYVNGLLIVRGITQCGDTLTWQRFVDALEKKHDLGGLTIEFSNSSHTGSRYVDVTVIGSSGRVQA